MKFSEDDSGGCSRIHIEAMNYKAAYDAQSGCLSKISSHWSSWNGSYIPEEGNKLKGIYTVHRQTGEVTNGQQMEEGDRTGIHTFYLNSEEDIPYVMSGVSQDAYPTDNQSKGLKSCEIFVFEDEEKRLKFLQQEFGDVLKKIAEGRKV